MIVMQQESVQYIPNICIGEPCVHGHALPDVAHTRESLYKALWFSLILPVLDQSQALYGGLLPSDLCFFPIGGAPTRHTSNFVTPKVYLHV